MKNALPMNTQEIGAVYYKNEQEKYALIVCYDTRKSRVYADLNKYPNLEVGSLVTFNPEERDFAIHAKIISVEPITEPLIDITVEWYSMPRGYGICFDAEGSKYFLHRSALTDYFKRLGRKMTREDYPSKMKAYIWTNEKGKNIFWIESAEFAKPVRKEKPDANS